MQFISGSSDIIMSEVEKQKRCSWFVHKLKIKSAIVFNY